MGALVSAVSALALLVIMFATEWYGVAGVPDPSAVRPAVSTAENALARAHRDPLGAAGHDRGRARRRWSCTPPSASTATRPTPASIVAALGALSAVLLIYRVLIVLPAGDRVIDQKLGAVPGPALRAGHRLGRLRGDPRAARPRARAAGSGAPRRRRPRLSSRRSGV